MEGFSGGRDTGASLHRPSSRQDHNLPTQQSPDTPPPSGISPSFTNSPEPELKFVPGDPANPRNWPLWRKWSIILAITLIDLTVSWAASGYSPAETEMERIFGVGAEVGTLGLSLYVLGLALGPMTLAPLSEVGSSRSRVKCVLIGNSILGGVRFILFRMGCICV